uniref:Protein TFG n=1 Tax=Ascaris suum TaxID=6253 RepID=F1KZJ4_ASCSU
MRLESLRKYSENMVHNGGEVEATMVKARYGNDIRKMTVHHNDDLSYNDLVLMMQRIFKIKSANNISLKYKDQEGDLITMADDHDLLLALQNETSLSLVVITEGGETCSLRKLQGELELIRDTASALLDMLKTMGSAIGEHHPTLSNITERPDTPSLLNESVATIQPSVHEQVNNGMLAMSHPPAPCAHLDTPPMDMSASIRGAFESDHGEGTGTVPPAPKCDEVHTHSEPTTEVDISSSDQHISGAFTPVSHHMGGSDRSEPSTPMTNASAPSVPQQMGAQVPPPTQPSAPAAPAPVYAFGQPPQATVPPTSAASPPMPGVRAPIPAAPPATVPAAPTAPFGAPTQFGQQQHPPPPQQQFGVPPITQFQQQNTAPQSGVQQQFQQQQPPVAGFVHSPSMNSTVPSPPTSTPSMFGVPPAGTPTFGIPASQQQQPQMPPPPVSQMSFSSSSTPVPAASAYPQTGFRAGTPSYGAAAPVPQPSQQTASAIAGAPPSIMPPMGAPPIMPFSTAQGVNPFGRGAGHYARPSFPAGFQQ